MRPRLLALQGVRLVRSGKCMSIEIVEIAPSAGSWGALGALAEADGSAAHPHLRQLRQGSALRRDLADAVHHVARLHGRHPGMIDHAIAHATDPAERAWVDTAADAFALERTHLVRLVAAAGPLPSTPGHAESEAAAAAQRHALDMLAQSDRRGCATGAVLALAIDWADIRAMLDGAARMFGVEPLPARLPPPEATLRMVEALTVQPASERAMLFGAQQVFAQHRGLWSLLEARAGARTRA